MTKDVLIELVKHVLTAPTGAYLEPMPVPMKLAEDTDWDELYDMSEKQGVAQIVGYALKWNGTRVENSDKFAESVDWAMGLEGTMFYETNALFQAFEREGIDYCPINGLVTKMFYPLCWMRTMNDADVLVRQGDLGGACDIVRSMGYEDGAPTDAAATFVSASRMYRLELHTRLAINANTPDVWDGLEPANKSGRRYEMTNIGQFLYILRRCQRHMNDGGIKVLSVLDFVLLRRALGLDRDVAREAVKRVGLANTLETLAGVASAWLDFGTLDKKQQSFVDSIFSPKTPQRTATGVLDIFNRIFKPFAAGGGVLPRS